jgi:hypothetical protein
MILNFTLFLIKQTRLCRTWGSFGSRWFDELRNWEKGGFVVERKRKRKRKIKKRKEQKWKTSLIFAETSRRKKARKDDFCFLKCFFNKLNFAGINSEMIDFTFTSFITCLLIYQSVFHWVSLFKGQNFRLVDPYHCFAEHYMYMFHKLVSNEQQDTSVPHVSFLYSLFRGNKHKGEWGFIFDQKFLLFWKGCFK